MFKDRYNRTDLFALVPQRELRFELPLEQLGRLLDDNAIVHRVREEMARRSARSRSCDRPSIPIEVVLRRLVVMRLYGWSYAQGRALRPRQPGAPPLAPLKPKNSAQSRFSGKMFSRALANRCTLTIIGTDGVRPCRDPRNLRRHGIGGPYCPLAQRHGGRGMMPVRRGDPLSSVSGLETPPMADQDSLTHRQREIYNFIKSKIQGRGYGPTVREIGQEFDIKSPNGVMCHLKALQKKGLIHREPNMSRAIQLLNAPAGLRPRGLKLLGRIAAGPFIEAVEQAEELDFEEWEDSSDKFALQVTGDSMIDAHIADGDFVVIQRQEHARDGQIVAVQDDDGEVTLKRLYRDRNRVRLEPANKSMKPIYRDNVKILGTLVGVVRKY
jgi:repressor LexA